MRIIYFLSAFILGSSLFTVQAQTVPNYKIVNKIHLTGDAGWDYLYSDDAAGRLYVSHGTMVQVVDETNFQLVWTISGMQGVHGIAIDADLNKGYINSGRDATVTVFATKTLKVITRITVSGLNPDAILYDPFSKKVFTFNGKSNNSTIIDPATDKIVATIPLAGKPEFSVSDGKGKVYVNLEEENKICEINAVTQKPENVWSIAPGEKPIGLALNNETHRLFSVCRNKTMVIVNGETGKVIGTVPIGERADGAAFDPELKCAYSANGDGTLTVVKEENKDSFKVLGNIQTKKGARTIAVNRETHHIYLSIADFEPLKEGDGPKARPKIVPHSLVVLDIDLVE